MSSLTHSIGGYIGPSAGLDVVKRKISSPSRNQMLVPWLSSLFSSHYTSSKAFIVVIIAVVDFNKL
jgi:hypothetical protein